MVLEKTLESPWDCKEIQPVYSEGDQSWDFFGRNDAKAETLVLWPKLGVEESEVTMEASFTNDLGADSLDTVELIMEFEKEFGISIPDDQAEKIGSVGDAVSYIEEHAK